MPKRGAIALGLTALALVLLISFRTPDAGTETAAVGTGDAGSTTGGAARRPDALGVGLGRGRLGLRSSGTAGSAGTRTVDGPVVDTRYGAVQVEITVSVGKVTDVVALQLPDGDRRSASISSRAEPVLRSEALAAQSASIDGVSGATYTSDGYARVAPGGARRRGPVTAGSVAAEAPRRQLRVEPVMGTVVTIDVRAPFVDPAALEAAVAWFHDVDRRFSPFRDDSEVTRVGDGRPRARRREPGRPRDVHARRRGPRPVRRRLRPARPSGRTAVPTRRASSRAGRSTRRSRCCGWPGRATSRSSRAGTSSRPGEPGAGRAVADRHPAPGPTRTASRRAARPRPGRRDVRPLRARRAHRRRPHRAGSPPGCAA